MKKILIPILLSASFFNVNADETGNFYLGAGLGKLNLDNIPGVNIDTGTTPKLYVGYKFNSRIAVEGHYLSSNIDVTSINGSGTIDYSSTGVSLVSALPLNPKLSLLGKIGITSNTATVSAGGSSASADDSGLTYGIGMQYDINHNLGIRGEFEILEADASLFTIGANYTF